MAYINTEFHIECQNEDCNVNYNIDINNLLIDNINMTKLEYINNNTCIGLCPYCEINYIHIVEIYSIKLNNNNNNNLSISIDYIPKYNDDYEKYDNFMLRELIMENVSFHNFIK